MFLKKLSLSLTLLFALASSLLGFAQNTYAANDAHIKGTVTNEAGKALQGIEVIARYYNDYDDWWDRASSTRTDANGNYDLGGLSANTYRVEFQDNSGTYAKEYYDNANDIESAKDIPVTAGSTTTNINAKLALAGHIKGTVTNESGMALQGIEVTARYFDDINDWWEKARYVNTDANGHYDLGGLSANTYRVEFRDNSGNYARESYDNAKSIRIAKDIVVTAGGTVDNINAKLSDLAGRITGTVTDAAGKPLQNLEADLYYWNGKEWDWYGYYENIDSNGHYELKGLSAGTYRIGFWDDSGTYAMKYYKDAHFVQNSTNVVVKANETTSNIDGKFTDLSGHITGKLTNTAGNPLKGIQVIAYHWNGTRWHWYSYGISKADGSYDINRLNTGTYRVAFWKLGEKVPLEFYDNVATIKDATDIKVTVGKTTAGINAKLGDAASPPSKAVLLSPTGKITDNTPTYTWKAVSNATWYYLWVNDSTGNKIHKWYKAEQAGCSSGTGTCSITPSRSLANGKGTWWIKTWNRGGGYGPWSSGMSFTVAGESPPPAAATLISPKGTTTVHKPSYTWNAVSNATWYYLWVNAGTAKRFAKWYRASDAGCESGNSECKVIPNVSLANGDYKWWIRTWNSNGYGAWSSGMSFTITGAGGPPAAATLVSPAGTTKDNTPSYTWKAVSNSTWYYLWVNKGTAKNFAKWYKASDAGCESGTGECKVTPSTSLVNGDYKWWIQTWNSNGHGAWSKGMSFTVQTGSSAQRATPSNNFSSELNLTSPIKLGEEVEVNLLISPESEHVGKPADLILVLEYWPTKSIKDRMSFYRDVEGKWQVWTKAEELPPATRTYKELPAKIEETISLGVLELKGEYRWYAAYVLTDGTVVSRSEPLVFVVE